MNSYPTSFPTNHPTPCPRTLRHRHPPQMGKRLARMGFVDHCRSLLTAYHRAICARLRHRCLCSRQLRLMIVDHGHTAGAIDLFEFDPVNRRAGIGIVIDPSMRGRGIATGAIALFARLCGERLGIHQLWPYRLCQTRQRAICSKRPGLP